MSKEIVILADGRSKDSHIPNPYMVEINHIPLIIRTIMQFHERDCQVNLVTRDTELLHIMPQWVVPLYPMHQYEDMGELAMIPKAIDYMETDQSVAVFGDVCFTDEAVDTVIAHQTDEVAVYGRSTDNRYTGTPWAEWFAFELELRTQARARHAAHIVLDEHLRGNWLRATPWEWYYQMEDMKPSLTPRNMVTGPHWVEIDDETDDIDFGLDAINLQRTFYDK